jgi:hypothetical protein
VQAPWGRVHSLLCFMGIQPPTWLGSWGPGPRPLPPVLLPSLCSSARCCEISFMSTPFQALNSSILSSSLAKEKRLDLFFRERTQGVCGTGIHQGYLLVDQCSSPSPSRQPGSSSGPCVISLSLWPSRVIDKGQRTQCGILPTIA